MILTHTSFYLWSEHDWPLGQVYNIYLIDHSRAHARLTTCEFH